MRKMPTACVVAATFAAALAAGEPAAFMFLRDVTPPSAQTGEVAALTLDAAVFDALDDRMGNLRLFDDTGREQPCLVRRRTPVRTATRDRPFPSPSAAESLRQLPDNRIEIVVSRGTQHPPVCGLRLESDIRNFEKPVTVSASADGQNWTTLAAGEPIYDYSRFVDIRRDTIRFSPPARPSRPSSGRWGPSRRTRPSRPAGRRRHWAAGRCCPLPLRRWWSYSGFLWPGLPARSRLTSGTNSRRFFCVGFFCCGMGRAALL